MPGNTALRNLIAFLAGLHCTRPEPLCILGSFIFPLLSVLLPAFINALLFSSLSLRVCLYVGPHIFLMFLSPSHPWSHVVIGMWHKYPNSKCTHVVSIDTIDRSVDPKTGIIRTERVLGCKQKAPLWIVKVRLPSDFCISYLNLAFYAAFRRFRRCFCERNFLCGPGYTKRDYHLRQSFFITICDLLRTNSIHPRVCSPNSLHANGRNPGAGGFMAIGDG